MKKIFLAVLIVSVTASALTGIVVIVVGNFGEFESRVLATTFSIACASILGMACGAAYEGGRVRFLSAPGVVFAILAGLSWMFIIWNMERTGEYVAKSVMTLTLIAVALAHLSLVSLARLDNRFAWADTAIQGVVAALVFLLLILIWFTESFESDAMFRLIGVLSIVAAALTIMIPVFHKLSDVPPESVEGETPESRADAIDTEIAGLKERIAELEREREHL